MKRLHVKEDFTPTGVMSMVDSNGNAIQITDSANSNTLPDKLNVVVEATHTGINRNKVNYSYESLSKSTDSWTKNYSKPVLLNHDSHSDPLGRVKSADFKQSVINPEKHTIQLNLEITNKAAIERFLDGRYRTFSIGGYTDSATCSVCNKDQMTDGFCGHQRGKTYDGKECFWNLGAMEYDEISVVNSPADVHAQAISLSVVGEDGQEDSVPSDSTEPTGDNDDTKNTTPSDGTTSDDILNNIDGILGHTDSQEPTPAEPTEPSEPAEPTDKPKEDDSADDGAEPINDSVEKLKEEIATLKDKVATLESEIEAKEGIIAAKDSEIQSLEAERDNLKAELATATEDSEGLVKQNASLAKFAHSTLAERVVDLQIILGDKNIEDKEQLLKDYSLTTSKKLNDMINELHKPERITQRVKATNPAFANTDGTTDDDGFEKPGAQPKTVTLKDAAETMKNFLVNRQI